MGYLITAGVALVFGAILGYLIGIALADDREYQRGREHGWDACAEHHRVADTSDEELVRRVRGQGGWSTVTHLVAALAVVGLVLCCSWTFGGVPT